MTNFEVILVKRSRDSCINDVAKYVIKSLFLVVFFTGTVIVKL